MTARPGSPQTGSPETCPFDAIDWSNWEPDLQATLLFVVHGGEVLMIEKKRGLGAGKLNGAGGKIDPGETPLEAAVREYEEELGTTPLDPVQLGRVAFAVTQGDSIMIHVFRATQIDREPVETDEAVPVWHPEDDLPYDRMWEDDRYWLPLLLEGRTFAVRTLFDGDVMLGFSMEPDIEI